LTGFTLSKRLLNLFIMKYKIAIIGLLLANNTVAPYGTEVTGEQLTDSAEKLLKEGYIVEVAEETPAIDAAAQAAAEALKAQEDAAAQAKADAAAAVQAKADAKAAKADAAAKQAAADAAAQADGDALKAQEDAAAQAKADAAAATELDPASILNQGK
jgi:hypothetical protein